MDKKIKKILQESIDVKKKLLKSQQANIKKAARIVIDSLKNGGKVLLFGNGGSAADSQHLAAEFVGRFNVNRKALPAIALTTDSSILTCISNDFGYEKVFIRQLAALGRRGDVAFAISTSGNSESVIKAAEEARHIGMKVVALTGEGGGDLSSVADVVIKVPSRSTPRIQESHITIGHLICQLAEEEIFGRSQNKKR